MFGPEQTGQGSPFDFDAFYKFGGGESGFQHHAHFNFHAMFEEFYNNYVKMFQESQDSPSYSQCDGGGGEGWRCKIIIIMKYYRYFV